MRSCEDFHRKNADRPIRITITFHALNQEAQEDFADYVHQGQLVVSAVAIFDETSGKAEVKQYGQRFGMLGLMPFFEALGEGTKVAELKRITLSSNKPIVSCPSPEPRRPWSKLFEVTKVIVPISASSSPARTILRLLEGANRLARHVQWVYVPAVKDATTEQVEARNSALGKLLARTVRSQTNFEETIKALRNNMQGQYQSLLDENQQVLDDMSKALQVRLTEWAHPEATLRLRWKQDRDKSVRVEEPWAHILVGEGDFEGELALCVPKT